MPTLLHYGKLLIHTANEEGEIQIPFIKNPVETQEKILHFIYRNNGNALVRPLEAHTQPNPGGVHDLVQVLNRLVVPNRGVQEIRRDIGFAVDDQSIKSHAVVSPRFKKFIMRALLHPSAREKIIDDIRGELDRKKR